MLIKRSKKNLMNLNNLGLCHIEQWVLTSPIGEVFCRVA